MREEYRSSTYRSNSLNIYPMYIYSATTITSQCHSAPQITVISLELWRFVNYITYLLGCISE